jgi:hypothetical protein
MSSRCAKSKNGIVRFYDILGRNPAGSIQISKRDLLSYWIENQYPEHAMDMTSMF